MPEIISRKEAMARGLNRYFTGKPCKHGHVCERRITGSVCIQCERLWGRKYDRNNRCKRNARAKRYREKNLEKIYIREKKRYAENPGRRRKSQRKWYAENAEIGRKYASKRWQKISDLLAVLRLEMPDLLKEFGL